MLFSIFLAIYVKFLSSYFFVLAFFSALATVPNASLKMLFVPRVIPSMNGRLLIAPTILSIILLLMSYFLLPISNFQPLTSNFHYDNASIPISIAFSIVSLSMFSSSNLFSISLANIPFNVVVFAILFRS